MLRTPQARHRFVLIASVVLGIATFFAHTAEHRHETTVSGEHDAIVVDDHHD